LAETKVNDLQNPEGCPRKKSFASALRGHLYQPSSSSRTTASTEVAHRKFIVKILNLWYKRNKHLLEVDDPQVNSKKAHVLPLTNVKEKHLEENRKQSSTSVLTTITTAASNGNINDNLDESDDDNSIAPQPPPPPTAP
ncbi:unnamed protein product, partial [Didymodactylos carnosus]